MFGGRGLSVAACLCLAAGCAVIDATGEDADGDDAGAECLPIVRNAFDDDDEWGVYSEPGSSVVRSPDELHITAAPAEEDFSAYAHLGSTAIRAIGETRLQAMLTPGSEGSVAGISWTQDDPELDDDEDYYDLVVDFGRLVAARREAFGEHRVICPADCPLYDASMHAHFRLRSEMGEVLYEVSPDSEAWSEIARAPLADGVYRSMAFVYAAAPDVSELSVTQMEWAACER
ncbi:MAG TPA: hypothetical protein VIG06_13425 [Kofleriaceae bacterium]